MSGPLAYTTSTEAELGLVLASWHDQRKLLMRPGAPRQSSTAGLAFDVGGLRLKPAGGLQPDDRIVFDGLDLALDMLDAVVDAQFEQIAPDVVVLAVLGHDGVAAEGLRRGEVELREVVVFPCELTSAWV